MDNLDRTEDLGSSLQEYLKEAEESDSLSETQRIKREQTALILSGDLPFGGVEPRGPRKRKRKRRIGDPIRLNNDHASSESRTSCVMSAKATEERAYSPNTESLFDYPRNSTTRDRHQINKGFLTGFRRKNVLSTADMNACSLVTVRDFLIYALEHLDDATFSLIWVVCFVGLNHNRPIIEMQRGWRHPVDDEILVDAERGLIVYNLIRRRHSKDEDAFEFCGRMVVPVGRSISDGLIEIARLGTQQSCIASASRAARRFSKRSPGLTPTLPRLLASNAIHMARLGLTELQSAALRGRVQPALFGISAYHPHTVSGVVDAYKNVYRNALEQWCLPHAMRYEFGEIRGIDDGPIYCSASRGKALAANVLGAIGARYAKETEIIRTKYAIRDPRSLLDALNSHEQATYALQELGLGLRPVGDVAQASTASARNGALTRDKASRLFDERSYSPISAIHESVLAARAENRRLVRQIFARFGLSLNWAECDSGLAMKFTLDLGASSVQGRRIRGTEFRRYAAKLPTFLSGSEEPNWLRHVSLECLGSKVPRWLCDELHGHKIVGRQPFGRWSTVSIMEFDCLAEALEELHEEIVPTALLLPIKLDGSS